MAGRKNRKRWVALAISASMLASEPISLAAEGTGALAVGAELAEEEASDFEIDANGVLTGYLGKDTKVVIPSGTQGIGKKAFFNCASLTSVAIPDSVSNIKDYAFAGTGLESIKIPNSVTYMGDYAFAGCTKLKSASLPNDMLNVGGYAFSGCTALEDVTIPKGVEYILNGAFSGCTALKELTLPEGIYGIGNDAFLNCSNLTSITIPDSVHSYSIGDGAFSGCPKLTIYGKAGSDAERYAKQWGVRFVDPSIKKSAQTVKVTKTFQKTYGDKPFSLKAKVAKGDGALSYASSNHKVVTVDKNGKVTIKSTGAAIITITAAETAKYKEKSVKATIKVSPQKQKAPTVKAQKGKKCRVTWKTDARATGYVIQYSTDKKFKDKKATQQKAIEKSKGGPITIYKLKAGKRYYVRVRSYKKAKISGKTQKLYGAWSSAKSIKAEK